MMGSKGELTELLEAWQAGDEGAYMRVFSYMYDEIKLVARRSLNNKDRHAGWHTTELVQELFLVMLKKSQLSLENRKHFLNLSGRVARWYLVDQARKHSKKELPLDNNEMREKPYLGGLSEKQVLKVHDILNQLKTEDPELVKIVELRFFAGYTSVETANILDISRSTVERRWKEAKLLFFHRLEHN